MKRNILFFIVALTAATMTAQTQSYKLRISQNNGAETYMLTEDVKDMRFVKLGKVKVNISERYATSTSLGVNLDIEPNVSRLKAVCVPASQKVNDPQTYIEEHAEAQSVFSYKKAWDFLTPETDYVVYALAYDSNGLPSEVSQLELRTGKAEDDPFNVEAKNVTTTSLDYVVSPKNDPNVKYVVQTTGLEMYNKWCDDGDNNGDVFQHFVSYWKAMGNIYGHTWQDQIQYDARTGTYDSEADYNTQKTLLWDADQVIITFGVTLDGELVTPIQTTKVKTLAPVPSSNVIALELKSNAWRDVVVTATTSNDDTYLVNVQRAELVDPHLKAGDLVKWLLNSGTDYSLYSKSGSQDWEFSPNKGGEKYYAIGIGVDAYGAPTTEPVMIDFVLPEGGF